VQRSSESPISKPIKQGVIHCTRSDQNLISQLAIMPESSGVLESAEQKRSRNPKDNTQNQTFEPKGTTGPFDEGVKIGTQ
jgi:hypothetical protein